MASDSDFEPTLRLHPLSWLFVLVASLRQFIVPVIAVLFFGARDDGSLWGAVIVIPLVIAALWRQFLFRYGFGPRGLVIRDGLFFRNVRQIEYERIENIDTERGILHRLFNVAEARVETSTGGKPEGLIRVLGLDAVDELRRRVFERSHSAVKKPIARPAIVRPGEVLLHLSAAELMRFGFVDNRGLLVVAAVFGVLSQSGAMTGLTEFFGARLVRDEFGVLSISLAVVVLGALLALILFVRLLSLLWALVTLHDFTVTRHADDLRVRYGLLTRVALTLRIPRIQAAHQTQSLLHRFFGRVSLAVDLAGDGGQQTEDGNPQQKRMRWLAPICTPRRSGELIRIALPMLVDDTPPVWQALAPGARGRVFRKVVGVATFVCAVPAIIFMGAWAPLLWLVILPCAWLHATRYVRDTAWALTREALLFRRGWLTRRLAIVPRDRIQCVRHSSSPFDRRARMAVVSIDTAGASSTSSLVRIAYLHEETARMLAQSLYRSAQGSDSPDLDTDSLLSV